MAIATNERDGAAAAVTSKAVTRTAGCWLLVKGEWQQMKPWYQSRTIWVNVLVTIAALLNGPAGNIVPPEDLAIALAIVNLLLRLSTTQPLTLIP